MANLQGIPQNGTTPQYDPQTGLLVGYLPQGQNFQPTTQNVLNTPNGGIETFAPYIQPQPAAAAPAAAPAAASSAANAPSGANSSGGTAGIILPNGTVLPQGQSSGLVNAYNSWQSTGNAAYVPVIEAFQKQSGMNLQQLAQAVKAVQSGAVAVQGSNGQSMYRTPTGQYFSVGSDGTNIAASTQQLQSGGYPTLAGYGPNGQAYYAQPTTPNAAQAALAAKQAAAPTPEAAAYASAAATDPGLAKIIGNAESYYANQQASTAPPMGANGQPMTVPQLQKTYLQQQDAIDPTSAAARNTLGQTYLTDLNAANAGQLPSGVANQVQEAARTAQTARGNALGTAQASQEAMATGLTGLQIKQQAEQNQQSWLSSGLTPGQQSAALYDWRTGINNAANSNATSYLSSGQTPYGVGTGQLANTINQAQPSQTGTAYSPTYSGGPNYSYINPSAGQDFSTGSNNWYNSQTNAALGQGALANQQQANTYGLIGSALKAVGSIAGGAIGACWVAREVFGESDPRWLSFRSWMLNKSANDFREFYLKNGPEIAESIKDQPIVKELIGHLMKEIIYGRL